MYEPMPGFNRAQYDYDNQESPSGEGCICDEVFECDECGSEYAKPVDICTTIACDGMVEQVERNDSHEGAEQQCEVHGWCGGCSSRYCEDCNG